MVGPGAHKKILKMCFFIGNLFPRMFLFYSINALQRTSTEGLQQHVPQP